jgi:hypothetical protein
MPWHRPGVSFAIPKNALTDKPYRGSNILSLWIDADEKRFERQIWATFKQWVRRVSRMKGVTSWVREQCPALSPLPACGFGNEAVRSRDESLRKTPAIGEIRARRRSDG